MDDIIPGPAQPPRADAPLSPAEERRRRELEWAVPGTERGNEITHDEEQQGFLDNLVTGVKDTAAASGLRLIQDEGSRFADDLGVSPDNPAYVNNALLIAGSAKALFGERYGEADYDKSAKYDELTDGIPVYLHDEVMQDNLAAAQRARARVLGDIKRGRTIANQHGASSTFALLAGSVADVDLPLTFFTGGGYKAASVAGKALRIAEKAGVNARWATRVASGSVGASAGLQAGLVTGAAEASWSPTKDWTNVAEVALQSMLLGGTLNGVVHGDRQLAIRAAQDELHARMARNDPNLTEQPNVEAGAMSPIMRDEPFLMDKDGNPLPMEETSDAMDRKARREDMSVNAAAAPGAQPQMFQNATINDPAGNVSPTSRDIIKETEAWRYNSGWKDRKDFDSDAFWTKIALSDPANLSTNFFRTLYKSDASTLNWLAGNVFESPNGLGRGRFTAAAGQESYQRRIFGHISRELEPAMRDWAKRNNKTLAGTGFHISEEGVAAFNRHVMLELNDRALGRAVARDFAVVRAADAYEKAGQEALDISRGQSGQIALDGFQNVPDRRGYTPYVWDGNKLLRWLTDGTLQRNEVVNAMAQAYHTAGMVQYKDAQKIAEAVVGRAIARDTDIDMSLASLLSSDGREFLRQSLEQSGVPSAEIDAIIGRFTGDAAEKGKQGFAKSRNEIDLDTFIPTRSGKDIRIVDLMSNDMHGVWQRYTRRVAGSAALARVGLNNRIKIDDFIKAVRTEQRSLGEKPMDSDMLKAMFSHFNGGPIQGFSRGRTNVGVGSEIAVIKRLTNLALLGKLGAAQLAETAATISQVGLDNWLNRGVMRNFDAKLKADGNALLDDMAYITGQIGEDHKHFAPHLDLDELSDVDKADWLRRIQKITSNATWIQGFTSGFNQVRGYQQKIAAMGMADKVFRSVQEAMNSQTGLLDPKVMKRFEDDLGLMPEDIDNIERLIANGTIEFASSRRGKKYVNRLNMDKWDYEFAEVFASSISRNINQVVQKSMAGEQDAWMHTEWGSVLTHLKTFPLAALQKQFMRNMRHMDGQTLSILLYGMATAAVTTSVRDAIEGKERTTRERAALAFGYANVTGWIPMYFDPVMAAVGLEDYRINPYGQVNDYTPPAWTWVNKAMRLPGAIADKAMGNADWYDNQSIKALPFANTYGLSRLLDN